MTANELADELTKMFRGEEYDRLVHEIPDLLRQQQADLKDADKYALELERLYEDAKAEIEALKADKALHDEAYLSQMKEIEELKAKLQLHEAMDNQCASLMQQFRKASEI